jgi:hypothetical protein
MPMRGDRRLRAFTVLAAASFAAVSPIAQSQVSGDPAGIAEYRASYEVTHDGRRAATAEFSVVAAGAGEYLYRSVTEVRGLLKLIAPNPATEQSRLRLAGADLRSLQFDYVDGSRKGEDNFSINYDMAAGRIRITRAEGTETLPFEPDLLDRGSLQVAVMRDLASCRLPRSYRWVNDDGITTYRYERLDDRVAETGAGNMPTLRFRQQREGSSRQSILWLAPSQSFVPVIVEQIDDGETETVYTLSEITVTKPQTAACSGFR